MQALFVLMLVKLFADQFHAGHAPEESSKAGRAVAITLLLDAPNLGQVSGTLRIPFGPL